MLASIVLALSLVSNLPNLKFGGDSYMASHEMSLENRYGNAYVNDVFKDNILLTLRYLEGSVTEADKISWEAVQRHFNYQDGFKSDGYLFGDGVCHLASLMYWVAKDAGLEAVSPVNHNFANVPEVPKEYGVSISFRPNKTYGSALQNLYITNNKKMPISFVLSLTEKILK